MQRTAVKIDPDLPVFRLDDGARSVFYSPGHAVVLERSVADDAIRHDQGSAVEAVRSLLNAARTCVEEWNTQATDRFEPECLTLYLSNQCNLSCGYCYSAAPVDRRPQSTRAKPFSLPVIEKSEAPPVLDIATVAAAAKYVARSCRDRGRAFQLVLHGGGEPTLHWDLLQEIVRTTRQTAGDFGIDWNGYIATHGVLSTGQAEWLAGHFDHIGLSCDGPPELQDRYRRSGGNPTSPMLERTARIIVASGTHVTARVTIHPQTVERQAGIVDYLVQELGIFDLAFEPVYRAGGCDPAGAFAPDDAERFVDCFLRAQDRAELLGGTLRISGVRLDELHGPYCNVLRNTLHLTPDGSATACFLCTDGRRSDDAAFVIGKINPQSGEFEIDHGRIAAIRRKAAAIPERCRDCVNAYHCVRECPDVCPVTDAAGDLAHAPGFRCRVHLLLTERWLQRLVDSRDSSVPVASSSHPTR